MPNEETQPNAGRDPNKTTVRNNRNSTHKRHQWGLKSKYFNLVSPKHSKVCLDISWFRWDGILKAML